MMKLVIRGKEVEIDMSHVQEILDQSRERKLAMELLHHAMDSFSAYELQRAISNGKMVERRCQMQLPDNIILDAARLLK